MSSKVTHKMTIIWKFTMPRILWSYVSTLQIWISHVLYERLVFPRQNTMWLGTVRWGGGCWAAFKQGHHKLTNVRNCAILHTLHNFCLLISASNSYSWTYHIPLESICYLRHNEVHNRTNKCPVKVKSGHYKGIYIQKCYYVFVNIRKAISYAIGKVIVSASNGLLHRTIFIELQLLL